MLLSLIARGGRAGPGAPPRPKILRGLLPVAAALAGLLPGPVSGQGVYVTNGIEYAIAGNLPGDQVYPAVAISTNGGFLVWQDNVTDGDGSGIGAVRLDSNFSQVYSPFRVNQAGAGFQEHAQVALLANGGAAFVWQGGPLGAQHIYARFLSQTNTWLTPTNDILVNTSTSFVQISPVLARLANGNIVVVWSSFNQANTNSLQDIYAQILSPTGQKVGGEFRINLYVPFNQRNPSVAALSSGGFVVVWASEMQRTGPMDSFGSDPFSNIGTLPGVDIYARIYDSTGAPLSYEIPVNTGANPCSNPRVATGTDGGFMVVWGEKDMQNRNNSWDVLARPFSGAGIGGASRMVNTTLYGDQTMPQACALGTDYLVAWTSLGQDGSREGVYAQFLRGDGTPAGGEFRVNTTTISQQMHPTLASDGVGRFLAVWTSYVGQGKGFDLFAQRYINASLTLTPMNAPFVYVPFVFATVGTNSVYQPQLLVCWPFQVGLPVNHYEVYVDGAISPTVSVTTNVWLMTATNGLSTNSTHSFQVTYVLADGRRAPLSAPTSATTYKGQNWGGVPWEWMTYYYGDLTVWFDGNGIHYNWPAANVPLVPGGPTLLQVFLTGASPFDASTWLRTALEHRTIGYYLTWNPQPGLAYQVLVSTDLTTWSNLGTARLAAGTSDSVFVGGNNSAYYRVLRLR